MLKGSVPYSKGHGQVFRERLVRPLETVEKWLATRTFLVGERLSLADISAATVLRGPYSSITGKAECAKYPYTIRYYETVVNQPQIQDVLAGAVLAETAQQYVPPPKEQKPKVEKSRRRKRRTTTTTTNPLFPPSLRRTTRSTTSRKASSTSRTGSVRIDTRGAGGSPEWLYGKYALVPEDLGGFSDNFAFSV